MEAKTLDLYSYFDAVYLINLKRRQDRLLNVEKEMAEKGWCFKEPIIFPAIDGSIVPTPPGWQQGGGAFGCRQSHVRILEDCMMAGVRSVLILEDDICMRETFREEIEQFLSRVPDDWDQLMLGGQHISGAIPISPGVVKCTNCQRTHAYAVRGQFLRELYSQWAAPKMAVHVDWVMGGIQTKWKVYAPDPFLFGQDRSHSDICGRTNPKKFWVAAKQSQPLILLKSPRNVMQVLRDQHGLHCGYDRDPHSDIDKGLLNVFSSNTNRRHELRKWIDVIQDEVASGNGRLACLWHDQADLQEVKGCSAYPVIEVTANTVEEALAQLPQETSTPERSSLVLLNAKKEVAQGLVEKGFHRGYWRDPVTDQDNGLRAIMEGDFDAQKLRDLVYVLQGEADRIPGGVVTLWHPKLTAEKVRESLPEKEVLEVSGDTVDECLKRFHELKQ